MTAEKQIHPLELEAAELMRKGYEIRVNDVSLSLELTYKSLAIAATLEHGNLQASARSQLGLLKMIQGEFDEALTLSHEALAYFEKSDDSRGIANAKYNIAGVHYKTDNYHLGLQYLLDCLWIYKELHDRHNEARVLKSMGTIYEYFGDMDNAIESYLKAIELGRLINDPNLESNAYNPLSGIYLKRGDYDLARAIIDKSIEIKEQTQDLRGSAYALYGRGKVNLCQKKYDEAIADLSQSLSIHQTMGDKLGAAMALNKLGVTYLESKQYPEAEEFLLKALQTADDYDIRFIRFKGCHNLYLLKRAQGKVQEALEYLERYMAIKESVINRHTSNVIKSYETISKVEALEREAKAQRDRTEIIENKNAELDSFFYRVSHDLKGPISSLLGLHNLIKMEVQDEKAQYYFDLYQSQITRINNIVMDLIHLTRMGHQEESKVKIDFATLMDECILSYHYLDNYNTIRFVKEIDNSIEFYSQWAIVNTILQNLIENAIKYARPAKDPFVRIAIAAATDHVIIQVEDNGLGISPEHQAKVFSMFFRGNHRTQGTGLGLYILKRAVERLDGHVSFVSQSNVGSTFTIRLPLRRNPAFGKPTA